MKFWKTVNALEAIEVSRDDSTLRIFMFLLLIIL